MATRKRATTTGRIDGTRPNVTTRGNVTITKDTFVIIHDFWTGSYIIERNGMILRDKNGWTRRFVSRNGARKRISRERLGDFHN